MIKKGFEMENIITLLITLVGLTGLSFGLINADKSKGLETLTPETLKQLITPKTNLAPLSSRGERYFIGGRTYPLFTEVTFDPFDIKSGEKQTVVMKVQNPEPVKSVKVVLSTDSKSTTYDLALSDGTVLNGAWRGTWTFDDSRDKVYTFTFFATDSKGKKSSIDFSFGKEFPKK